jgi:DNA-directed RNA polymerase subunit RPC12/RpoP
MRGNRVKKEKALLYIKKANLECLEELPEQISPEKDHFSFIDKEGYKYFLTIKNINDKRSGFAIVKSHNPYTLENIQTYIYNNGGTAKVLSTKWSGGRNKIKLLCQECGAEYEVRWGHIYYNKKFQCNKCAYKDPHNKSTQEETNKICQKHGYNIIDSTYVSRHNFDMVDKYGYKYSNASVYTLDSRTNRMMKFSQENKYQIENMRLYIDKNNLNLKILSKENIDTKKGYLRAICSQCGKEFEIQWGNIIYYHHNRCPVCSKAESNYEFIIEEFLKEISVEYVREKRFSWCRNKRELPFDFYLPDYNTIIEVHGAQHYEENNFFTKTLEEQQEIDMYKKECCLRNGLKYIEIPYWEIKETGNFKNIISQNLIKEESI